MNKSVGSCDTESLRFRLRTFSAAEVSGSELVDAAGVLADPVKVTLKM